MANKELTYKDVWDKLSKIDCSDKIEKKMNLSYLSWAWAWGVLMEHYPQATYLYYQGESDVPYVRYPDGTAEVRCRVSIDNVTREMTLCVMDNRNNAIQNPNSSQVNNSKMRCMVKCLAMLGLGHYIYAGEDVPEDVAVADIEIEDKPVEKKAEPIAEKPKEVEKDKTWAITYVDSFLKLAKLQSSKDGMTSYYKSNTKDLTVLRESFPELKKALDEELKLIVKTLEEEKNNG
tara:strand:- start:304 stop:1002 length:699 start_codon:yes stop_codon:yes gene_type:complete